MAETEGFEPSVGVIPLRRFSKPLVSATHPRLRRRRLDPIEPRIQSFNRAVEAIRPEPPAGPRTSGARPEPISAESVGFPAIGR